MTPILIRTFTFVYFVAHTVVSPLAGQEIRSRSFYLDYGATINELPADAKVKVWFPIPQSNSWQTVEIEKMSTPGKLQKNKEPKYDNQIGFFEFDSKSKSTEFGARYKIHRKETNPESGNRTLSVEQKNLYLQKNRLVPIDGKPTELLSEKKLSRDPMKLGQELYEIVEAYMTYDKSQPGYGNGDVLWACSSKTGNCTDFHSLFISLARKQGIPARFEIGFPIPEGKTQGKIGGYHCWAWFYTDEKGWVAVDISEADKRPEMKDYFFGKLTPDRVAFSTGRDIELIPESKNGPLNYFVYPHIEVNGKPWPKKKIELSLQFENTQSN